MPPLTEYGPFLDTPLGDPVMDDIQIIDPLDDRDYQVGGAKKNKKDGNNGSKGAQFQYEGFILERVKPKTGDKVSWRRCGRSPLPSSQEQLAALGKNHRKLTGKSTNTYFKRLSGNQRGMINRIIEEKKLNEKSKTAEWSLDDVQTIERGSLLSKKEVIRLQIVIKRTDKGNDKGGIAAIGNASYPAEDIIDLSIPLKKKDKKNKSHGVDLLDDPLGMGSLGLGDMPQRDDYREPYREPGPQYDQPPPPPPPNHYPPTQAPLPAEWQQYPYDQNQNGQYPIDPHAQPVGGARDFNNNPFQPHPNVALPGQYDDPITNNNFPHPHAQSHMRNRTRSADRHRSNANNDYSRSRSRSNNRRALARRPSRSRRRRDDSVEDVSRKLERMMSHRDYERSSTDSNLDERSLFSRSDRDRYSYGRGSPPTSVDDGGSDYYYSRDGGKRYWRDGRRDDGERPRHRSSRYQDAEYYREPEYTYRSPRNRGHERDGRYSPDRRPLPITYDDYPAGRAAEPRYLPPTAPVPPAMPRRNTDFFGGGGGDRRSEYYAGGREYQDWRRQEDDFARAEQRRQNGAYYN